MIDCVPIGSELELGELGAQRVAVDHGYLIVVQAFTQILIWLEGAIDG